MFSNPPQRPPTFKISAESIVPAIQEIIARSKAINDAVAKVERPTFDSVIRPLAFDEAHISGASRYSLLKEVSASKAVRDAATEAWQILSDYTVESSMRPDVYRAVKAVYDGKPDLQGEDQRLLEKMELDFRRNGLSLPPDTQDTIKSLQKKMTNISITFSQNLGEEAGGVWFTKTELEGVPEDLVETWEKRSVDSTPEYKMTFKYTDIFPTTKYAVSEETRHKAWVAYESKVPDNSKLMLEMIQLRKEVSALMGYKNYADYVLEVKMTKDGATVLAFLEDLASKLKAAGVRDLGELKEVKRAHGNDQPFKTWDSSWANRLLVEEKYQVDAQKVAEYFEMGHTISQMLGIYETLFSLKFVELAQDHKDYDVWHPEVRQFSVFRQDTAEFVGWLYMDMFPREGKFGHAAQFGISPGYIDEEGKRRYPVAALVCNFSKPTKVKPSLLKHDEVVTFFHELGHGIHDLVSQTKWSRFHGTAVVPDFVEAPSQMLENWCWKKNVLDFVSRHYETGEPLPEDLIEKMQKAKDVGQGLFNLRQLHFGLFDMKLHTDYNSTTEADLTRLWNSMRQEIAMLDSSPDNPAGQASFAHIMGGYEAGYYGYMWSKVYSSDMFATKFEGHELDPEVGAMYRDTVLKPGGSRDAIDSLRLFLGREPNNKAFLRELGLES